MRPWMVFWLLMAAAMPVCAETDVLRAVVPASFPPQYSLNDQGEPTGFAIEVMDRVAAIAGLRIQYEARGTWEDVFKALESGNTDIVPNMGITPERELYCRFTRPLETYPISMFVRKGAFGAVMPEKPDRGRIGVGRRNAGAAIVGQYPGAEAILFDDPEQALFQGLLSGRIDALVYPEPVILQIAENAGVADRIQVAGPPLKEIKRAIGVCLERQYLVGRLNHAIDTFVGSPEYREIYLRWHGLPEPFWTPRRVAGIMGGGLFLMLLLMFFWRYASIRSLNVRLGESAARYESLALLSPVGIFRTDPDGQCVWVNQTWKAVSGMTLYQSLGKGWESAVHPGDREQLQQEWADAVRENRMFRLDYRFRRPDGRTTWLAGRAVPQKDAAGKLLGFIGTISDITKAKDFESAMQEVLNALPLNIAVLDARGNIMATNQRWNNFTLENGGDIACTGLGANYFDVCERAGDTEVTAGLRAVMERSADIFIWEYPCDSPDERRWFLLWVIPLEDGSGGMVVTHMDITKRKLAEEALEKHRQALTDQVRDRTKELRDANIELKLNEERLESLLAISLMKDKTEKEIVDFSLEEAVRLTDSEIGYLHFVNPDQETLRLFTWSRATMDKCTAIKASHYPISEAGVWVDCIEAREAVIHNDYPNLPNKKGMPEGHFPVYRHMSVPVFDGDKVVAVAGVGNKKAPYGKNDANRLVVFMSTMWSILQRQRMEDNLQRAKDIAEQANRAKSEFLSHMSHELRTPLNGIHGFFQLIVSKIEKNRTDPEKIKMMAGQGLESSRHLIAIVNDLLDLSRIEAGRISFDFVSLNLSEVLDQMRSRISSLAVQKGLSLSVDCSKAITNVRADRKFLDQILFNLIGNAIKFTNEGMIRVSCRQINGHLAEIAVSDTGCGIARQDLVRIFDRFEMLGGSSRTVEGTGLGLTISRKLVEMMGGTIHVTSEPGKGSTFRFTLPLINGIKEMRNVENNDR